MLDDAHRAEFSVLVVWAVDRLCRQGIEELLRLIRELRERNVSPVSHQEPWLNGSDATTELLAAVAAWVARQESVRRSERIRAGLGAWVSNTQSHFRASVSPSPALRGPTETFWYPRKRRISLRLRLVTHAPHMEGRLSSEQR